MKSFGMFVYWGGQYLYRALYNFLHWQKGSPVYFLL